MLYRSHANLSFGLQKGVGISKGQIIESWRLSKKAAATLLDMGTISIVRSPPITIYPLLEEYEESLGNVGIMDVSDFLEASNKTISEATNVHVGVIIKMKVGLREILSIPLSSLTSECCGG